MTATIVPESAPFNAEQRAWLNGFLAGFIGVPQVDSQNLAVQLLGQGTAPTSETENLDDAPWHDASLPIADRMQLAEGQPLQHKLMAAMAQLDCGSCGYVCKTYSQAIASGAEKNLSLCSPGGKETKSMLKKLTAESIEKPVPRTSSNGTTTLAANGTGAYSRQNPYLATLIESRPLNREGSAKDTRHVAIDLGDSGLTYHVGDALGIYPTNCRELVNAVLNLLAADPQMHVRTPLGLKKPLQLALLEDYCLKEPSDALLELLTDRVIDDEHRATLDMMQHEGAPAGFDVLDVLELARGATLSATEFIETLSALTPRLYSIASSMRHVGKQVHLTVGKVVYQREGRTRKGVASTMLAERLESGDKLRVFVHPNHGGFTVPSNPSTPIVMIGPGTGIAPFIAFLQERSQLKAPGKNWLFFGDQHASFDFLYETELRQWQSSGLLTHLHTAFSRDGTQKVYVQDRMREHSAELWQWLQTGAHFYVCGDASRMAADVDRELHRIIATEGHLSDEQATAFVKQLARDHRYVRDVY